MENTAKRVEIIPAKRRALILEHLRGNGAASIQEMAVAIGASQSTIRRDFEHLTEAGYLQRTHGGAMLIPQTPATFEGEAAVRGQLQRAEKQAIGVEAARRLSANQSVIFDSSTTVMEAVRAAAQQSYPLTAVTNSLPIATLSSNVANWRVVVSGGTIRQQSNFMTGEPGVSFLETIHADVCLIGSHAVSGNLLTDASLEVASLKRALMNAARRTILLADSSKFRPPAFCVFAEVTQVDEIITDDGIDPSHLEGLRALDVEVTVVTTSE